MRKHFLIILLIFILFISILAIWLAFQHISQPVSQASSNEAIANRELADMTLEEKVGQMFIVGYNTQDPAEVDKLIQQQHIGGIILFSKNIKDKNQLADFIGSVQNEAQKTSPHLPLFTSVDQEGGSVIRIPFNGEDISKPQSEITSVQEAYTIAETRAAILQDNHISMNYAPVLDYITDKNSFLYDRAFHGSPQTVSLLGAAMIKGFKDKHIIAVAKHFPGHANALDPHNDLPVATLSAHELQTSMQPFAYVIAHQTPDVIMVGHILYPAIDKDNPASLSSHFIRNMLINQLQYHGVIMTDDMQMAAISKKYTVETAAVQAIIAGNDMLLYTDNDGTQKIAMQAVISAVHTGTISQKQIDQSVKKILLLKLAYLQNH